MENLFDILAIVQIAAGLYLLWQGIVWLTYVRRRLSTDPGFYAPRTAVICPCRGMEPGLERNLVSLCEFDHQNYEVFFVLASESDPAYSIVKRVASTSRVKAHIVIAGKPENCSEKVNNLRVAVEQVPPEFEVLVFADSDGRPGKTWLHHLVAPLTDSRIGATTTMRWFMPNDNGLATALLAAWNASVVTMLGPHNKNFCWGGGTAIRRSVFEQIGMLDAWQYSFSDDYSLTMMIERSRRQIVFLPECLTPSYRANGFFRPPRVYQPPDAHHADLSPADVGYRIRHAFSLLLHLSTRTVHCDESYFSFSTRLPRYPLFWCFRCFLRPSAGQSV